MLDSFLVFEAIDYVVLVNSFKLILIHNLLEGDPMSHISTKEIASMLKHYLHHASPDSVLRNDYFLLPNENSKLVFISIMALKVVNLISDSLKKSATNTETSIIVELLKDSGVLNSKYLVKAEQLSILVPLLTEFLNYEFAGFEGVQRASRFDLSVTLKMRNEKLTSTAENFKSALKITSAFISERAKGFAEKFKPVNNNIKLIA